MDGKEVMRLKKIIIITLPGENLQRVRQQQVEVAPTITSAKVGFHKSCFACRRINFHCQRVGLTLVRLTNRLTSWQASPVGLCRCRPTGFSHVDTCCFCCSLLAPPSPLVSCLSVCFAQWPPVDVCLPLSSSLLLTN